jgi:hypothetical protein
MVTKTKVSMDTTTRRMEQEGREEMDDSGEMGVVGVGRE